MKLHTTKWTAALLMLGLAMACSPSAKNESQYWENNKKSVAEFSAKYPGFKTVLDADLKKATGVWDEAAGVADEEAKAKKMQEANKIVGELVGKLNEVKFKSEGIKSTIKKMDALKLDKAKDKDRKKAVKKAEKSIEKVDEALKEAKPADKAEALKILNKQISELISSAGDADRALTGLKPKKASKPTGKKKK